MAAPADPDPVAAGVQLDALVDQFDRRPVEAAAIAQVAVGWDPHHPAEREVKRLRRQHPQPGTLLSEPLGDDEAAGRVPTLMRDAVTPIGIDRIKFTQRLKA